ncbi:MAG: ftsW [Solirubrobacterales bacterium]|nr:ftsW [Solirubrobacterales bacterium]
MASNPRLMPPSRERSQPLEANILLTATFCLLAAGAVMVYSASSARTLLQGQGDGTAFLVKYIGYGAIGLVAMHVLSRRGLEYVVRFTTPFLFVCFGLLVAVKIPGIGVEINGARRWIGAGPLQFQPSELMKLGLVLYAVKLLATKPKIVRSPRLLVPFGTVAVAACALIASQPDLGTALVISFTMATLLIAAGLSGRHLMTAIGAAVVLILLFALLEPYRRARLTTFLNPWADAGGDGFQSVQGQIALGSGGLFGRGLGESVQKVFYLPEAHTDFILAIIGEELGVLGVGVVLFLYGLIAYAGLRVAKGAKGAYGKLLAVGLTSMILCQGTLNVFTVLGLAPLTGVPLPFLSYGSTNLMVLLASMGLLLNVAQGGVAHVRAVPGSRADDTSADRSRRDSRPRGARPGGRRRATG